MGAFNLLISSLTISIQFLYVFFYIALKGFSNESEMIDAYVSSQAKTPLQAVVAVVFEQYNNNTIKYKIRHSWEIQNNLYLSVFGEGFGPSSAIYFNPCPFVQVQMCTDRALINEIVLGSMSKIKVS